MAWYLLPLAVDGLALWLFSRLVAYDPRYLWARTFPVAIGIPALGVAAVVVAYTKTASLSIHGVAWDVFLAALFTLPLAPLATWWVAERFLKLIHAPDAPGIRLNTTCDQAARAEAEGKFAEAEALFRDALFRKGLGKRPDGAEIHLAFANYLQRRGREAEAADHWEGAVRFGIAPEKALTAAIRASEVYNERLKRPARAAHVLRLALRKYPNLPEAYALRQRIEALEERSDA
jgi:tetratricopeptide (TPR) repeat protein